MAEVYKDMTSRRVVKGDVLLRTNATMEETVDKRLR